MTIKTPIIVSLAALAVAGPAQAAGSASKEETIGVGTGVLVGALAGGPVGAIIGAAVGAKLGDSFNDRGERIAALDADLDGSRRTVASLENNVDTLAAEVDRLEALARPELISLMAAGIEMDLLFRTDEHALTPEGSARLAEFAGTLAGLPGIAVRIDGYSDERGDEAYNRTLSKKRAQHVQGLFVNAGMSPDRISVTAHGESPAGEKTPDSYALERKVSITVFSDESTSLAQAPGH